MSIHRQCFRFLQFDHNRNNNGPALVIYTHTHTHSCCLCPVQYKAALFTQWMCLCPISNRKCYKRIRFVYKYRIYVESIPFQLSKPCSTDVWMKTVCKIKKELLLTHYHSTRGEKRFQLFVQQRLDGLLLRYVRNVAVCVL